MHGPVIAPWFGAGKPLGAAPGIGGAREGLIAFELPIGYAFAPGHRSFTIGLGLRSWLTLF
jgi:hypothetical protein